MPSRTLLPLGARHSPHPQPRQPAQPRSETGEVISRGRLDGLVAERVVARFGHRLLNDDALFADRVPTAENIARAIHGELAPSLAEMGSARLVRIRVHETRKNSFAYGETS